MAKLYIAEFSAQAYVGTNQVLQLPQVPPVAGQVVTFTTTTQSSALNAATTFVRVVADADCHLEVAANPTATTSSVIKLTAGQPEYFGVTAGHKIAAVTAA